MPWLSLLMTLLAYLLAPRGTAAERRNALLGAALVGGGTYAVTHYTDWGKENLGQFDGVIDDEVMGPPAPGTGYKPPPSGSAWDRFWQTIQSWGPGGTAAVIGTGAAAVSGNMNWLIIGGLAIGAILLLK